MRLRVASIRHVVPFELPHSLFCFEAGGGVHCAVGGQGGRGMHEGTQIGVCAVHTRENMIFRARLLTPFCAFEGPPPSAGTGAFEGRPVGLVTDSFEPRIQTHSSFVARRVIPTGPPV